MSAPQQQKAKDGSRQTLATYEEWHRELRLKYREETLTKSIAVQYGELGKAGQGIVDRLQEFTDMSHLPGRCDLC